jgi:hypothetical protein
LSGIDWLTKARLFFNHEEREENEAVCRMALVRQYR